ncbi:MAG: NFYB/HAP3 family transcription factor subunit [Candidatus Marsarchaeota archaeon]|nr:NFYB/HAP3 family transcription factor subunit [Candidatus Marsarchaeota archaeon]
MEKVFSLNEMDRIMRIAGAQRVGEDASIKLGEIVEDSGKELISKASFLAKYAGRKTIMKKDILLAVKQLKVNPV